MPLQTYINYARGPLQVSFSFRVEMLGFVMVSAFYFMFPCGCHFQLWGSTIWFALPQLFQTYLWQAYVHLCDGMRLTPGMYQVAAPSTLCCSVSCPPPAIPAIWWGINLGGSAEGHPTPLPALHGVERSSFPGLVPPDNMADSKSVVAMKPGDSGVVIWYRFDEFTHTWSVEQFVS